jgi:catechol 2,3-dioxygenase-like lactoylglutathione lyase family enzyme
MRVSGLLNCGLQIPSLEAGRSFYKDFGLEVSEQGNALAVRCTGRNQDQLILTEGPRKRLDHVAFAVEPGPLPDWQRHLEGLGVRLLYIGDGLWFEDEEGNLIRLRDTGLAPWRPFPPEAFNVGDSVTRTDAARWLAAAEPPRPRRLGHMLIFVADIVAAEAFYTRTLGLRLSDRVPGKSDVSELRARRSPCVRVRAEHASRPAPHQLRGGEHRPARDGRAADGSERSPGRLGAWAGTASAPTSSTTSGTPGAAGSSTSPTSTTSPRTGPGASGRPRRLCGAPLMPDQFLVNLEDKR